MPRLSYGQLEELWIKAGGPKAVAPLMAAIALAESGGEGNAVNRTDNNGTQTSWGFWQVSDGTHNEPVPGILDPLVNAKAAVGKYKTQGLSAWGTYTSGAYKKFYRGKIPPSQLPSGGSGGTQLASWWNPVSDLNSIGNAVGSSAKLLLEPGQVFASNAEAVSGLATGIVTLSNDFGALLKDVEWLFVPAHWVRIFAFGVGTAALLPGLHELSQAGQGDMSLAVGIGLTTLAGVAYFIAFHNLPADIVSLSDLLAYISAALRGQTWTGGGTFVPIPPGGGVAPLVTDPFATPGASRSAGAAKTGVG